MAEIVMGVGASHTTLMNTQWEKVDHLESAHAFRDALVEASGKLTEMRPDAVVIIGSNHFRGQWLDLMPSFLLGVDEIEASGEHGTPKGLLQSSPDVAQEICNRLIAQNFDIAFSTHLAVDHGISHAVQWLLGEMQVPVIPLVINCFAPPLPSLSRCMDLGRSLRAAIQGLEDVDSVAIIGTGGLSHSLPFPDWRSPQSDDDEFLADSWRNGRGHWERYEARRRKIVVNAPAVINRQFDENFLDALTRGDAKSVGEQLSNEDVVAKAGNGGNEIRAWLTMLAAMEFEKAEVLCYSPIDEWLTGMAVALVRPE